MKVFQTRFQRKDGIGNALFFNVGVKSVKGDADTWISNGITQGLSLDRCSQEECLGTVHRLNRQGHGIGIKSISKFLKDLNGPVPFILIAPPPRKVAYRRKK